MVVISRFRRAARLMGFTIEGLQDLLEAHGVEHAIDL